MIQESGKIEQDVFLEEDLQLHGMCTGLITVPSGRVLILNGMAAGVLVLEGGFARIHGMVTDVLRNNGGDVEIFGTVRRLVESGGTTAIAEHARVDQRVNMRLSE